MTQDERDKKKLVVRLKRVEGQLHAVRRMIEEDRACMDVLTQIAAAQGALRKVSHILINDHIQYCVNEALEHGDDAARQQKLNELMSIFTRYTTMGQ